MLTVFRWHKAMCFFFIRVPRIFCSWFHLRIHLSSITATIVHTGTDRTGRIETTRYYCYWRLKQSNWLGVGKTMSGEKSPCLSYWFPIRSLVLIRISCCSVVHWLLSHAISCLGRIALSEGLPTCLLFSLSRQRRCVESTCCCITARYPFVSYSHKTGATTSGIAMPAQIKTGFMCRRGHRHRQTSSVLCS